MKKGAFFVSLFLAVGTLQAQYSDSLTVVITTDDPATLPATQEYAAEKIEVRKFDTQRWREVVGGQQYNDARRRQAQPEQRGGASSGRGSGRRQTGNEEDDGWYSDEDAGVNIGWLGPLSQIFFYGVIAAIIILILYQIARNVSLRPNPKKPADASRSPDEVHDITELDTENLIQQAHASGNYKLAIRLYFLHLLKKLNENGSIAWTKDKTNRDYLSELFSKQYYFDEVRKLTLAYERVWYGEHVPTAETYQELSSEFKSIDQKLNAGSRS